MKVTIELTDHTTPAKPSIRIHNGWADGEKVELEIDGERYVVDGQELISAVQRALLDPFGR